MKALRTILETDWNKSIYDHHKQLQHLEGKLQNHYYPFDRVQSHSIASYTTMSSGLNAYHWFKHKEPGLHIPMEDYDEFSKHMDSALTRYSTPHKITVYSGTRFDPRENMNKKGIVHHPAYLSTSLSKNKATEFGSFGYQNGYNKYHVMRISVPKGHAGAYVDHYSNSPNEREFILPRGLNLKHIHTQVHRTTDDLGTKREIHEHHMEIV